VNKMKSISLFKKIILGGTIALLAGAYPLYCLNHKKEPNIENIGSIKGVESVVANLGNVPDVIIILQNHIDQNEREEDIYSRASHGDSISSISKICSTLYDNFGVKSLLPEGLDPSLEKMYNEKNRISFRDYDSTGYVRSLEELINGRRWNLKFAEDPKKRDELEDLKKPLKDIYDSVLKETSISMDRITKKYENKPEDIQKDIEISSSLEKANKKIKGLVDIYMTDEITQKFYELMIEQRDAMYASVCKDAKNKGETPLIVIYGSAHCYTLPKHLDGLSYITIKPENLAEIKPIDLQGIKERFYMRLSRK